MAMKPSMLLADAHVHIHGCYPLSAFFDSAQENFRRNARRIGVVRYEAFLLLSEGADAAFFTRLRRLAARREKVAEGWTLHGTAESHSLRAISSAGAGFVVVAGSQVVTAEGLEVLALFNAERFPDGMQALPLLAQVRRGGGVPVIPWGFGKWFGRRGKFLKELLLSQQSGTLFLGDNGGRPRLLSKPKAFGMAAERGIGVLPGSDPLPFRREYRRPGSFGFALGGSVSSRTPAEDLKRTLLASPMAVRPYGHLEHLFPFVRNQLSMQYRKRFRPFIES